MNSENTDSTLEADEIMRMTTDIVASFVANNPVPTDSLSDLIASVHKTVSGLASKETAPVQERPKPAVPIGKSITEDHIICLEDGKKLKMLNYMQFCPEISIGGNGWLRNTEPKYLIQRSSESKPPPLLWAGASRTPVNAAPAGSGGADFLGPRAKRRVRENWGNHSSLTGSDPRTSYLGSHRERVFLGTPLRPGATAR